MDKILGAAMNVAGELIGSDTGTALAGELVGEVLNAVVPEQDEDTVSSVLRAAADHLDQG